MIALVAVVTQFEGVQPAAEHHAAKDGGLSETSVYNAVKSLNKPVTLLLNKEEQPLRQYYLEVKLASEIYNYIDQGIFELEESERSGLAFPFVVVCDKLHSSEPSELLSSVVAKIRNKKKADGDQSNHEFIVLFVLKASRGLEIAIEFVKPDLGIDSELKALVEKSNLPRLPLEVVLYNIFEGILEISKHQRFELPKPQTAHGRQYLPPAHWKAKGPNMQSRRPRSSSSHLVTILAGVVWLGGLASILHTGGVVGAIQKRVGDIKVRGNVGFKSRSSSSRKLKAKQEGDYRRDNGHKRRNSKSQRKSSQSRIARGKVVSLRKPKVQSVAALATSQQNSTAMKNRESTHAVKEI